MKITVRRAEDRDIPRIHALLGQVLNIHAYIRPDVFIKDTTKYTNEELKEIIHDEVTPVFAAVDEDDVLIGYAFCIFQRPAHLNNMQDVTVLYIDDLCVDENCRGQHIGNLLLEHVLTFAKAHHCTDVTLNVWEGNDSARRFYEKEGFKVRSTMMEIKL